MGRVGFVFDLDFENEFAVKKIFLDDKYIKKKFLVVFTSKSNVLGDYIIYGEKFDLNDCSFFSLSKDLKIDGFDIDLKEKFKIAKVCVNEKQVIDFNYNTFWFEAKRYKEIRNLMYINDFRVSLEDEIKRRIIDLYEFFNK